MRPIILVRSETDSQPVFSAGLATAGLLTGVGLTWASHLLSGGLDDTWLLSVFLAAGLGIPVVRAIEWIGRRLSGDSTSPALEDTDQEDDLPEEGERMPEPRFWVLIVSACLEAVAVGLLAGYFSGSLIVLIAAGLVAGVLAIGIVLLLARMLSPA